MRNEKRKSKMRFIGNELARLRMDGRLGRVGGGVETGTKTKNSDRFAGKCLAEVPNKVAGWEREIGDRIWSVRGGGGTTGRGRDWIAVWGGWR